MTRVVFAVLLISVAFEADAYQYWNDFRNSALLPDDAVTIKVENPSGAGTENYLLYTNSGVSEEPMSPVVDGPSTVSATVPGPVSESRHYGFRLLQAGDIDFIPVRIPDGATPAPQDLTRLATDVTGDELFGFTHLDLTDCHVSFSDTRLYATLQNAGGGFPVNQGFTFFGYLLGIADPALADPDTVFALMYTFEQVGIISPGLYKITGTGLGDLEKIGEVTVDEYPAENRLMLSCELADLLSDPDFTAWYDPGDPVIGVAGFTQRITLLGGAAEADRSPGGRCTLREVRIDPGSNELPELAGFVIVGSGASAYAEVVYEDGDANCPVLSEIVFDDSAHFPVFPQTLDYGLPVTYRTEAGIDPLATGEWDSAVARFSDDLANVVELPYAGAAGVGGHDQAAAQLPRVWNAPNPFSFSTHFHFEVTGTDRLRLTVFDVAGRSVAVVADGNFTPGVHTVRWNGQDGRGRSLPAGTYFYRVQGRGNRGGNGRLRLVR